MEKKKKKRKLPSKKDGFFWILHTFSKIQNGDTDTERDPLSWLLHHRFAIIMHSVISISV